MPRPLDNRTVAITEHRFEKEFASLIERHGASVISCPLLEERPVENHDELGLFIDRLIGGELDLMVFFTGIGVRFLAVEAESHQKLSDFVAALGPLRIVARGPKPKAALQKLGRQVDLAPQKPTSDGLLDLLENEDLRGVRVGVQLYGKPNDAFCEGLVAMGAAVSTVQVYDYAPASDRGRIRDFIKTLLSDSVDVVTFTSGPQITSLFDVADEAGLSDPLVQRMNESMAVAVIGEVADRSLQRRGIRARICPTVPKMAPMAQAIADYYDGGTE
jgi:uroporphyrinogen-III synthase